LSVKGNLLANPSFDGGIEGWILVQTSGPYAWDTANARVPLGREAGGPSYAFRVTLLPDSPFRLRNEVYVPVDAGKDYHLGIYAKGGSASTTLRLGVRYLSTGWSYLETHYTEVTLNTATYQLIQFSSAPPPMAAYANVGIWVNNTGTTNVNVFLDDAFMYEVDYPVMNRLFIWNNDSTSQVFLNPPNYFRLYSISAINYGTTSSAVVNIYDETNYAYTFVAFVLGTRGSPNSFLTLAFNPPVYSPLASGRVMIKSSPATGDFVSVRVYYNGAPNRSIGLGTI